MSIVLDITNNQQLMDGSVQIVMTTMISITQTRQTIYTTKDCIYTIEHIRLLNVQNVQKKWISIVCQVNILLLYGSKQMSSQAIYLFAAV